MQVSRSFRDASVFVLRWEDVDRLHCRFADEFPIITIKASCADGLTREFSDLGELKQFSNAKRVAIDTLQFECRDQVYKNRSSIYFEASAAKNVRFSVDANEVAGTSLNTFFMDFLDSIRPWYSKLAGFDFSIAVTVIALTSTMLLVLFAWLKGFLKSVTVSAGSGERAFKSFAASVVIMVTAGLLNHFKGKFFPMGSFAFGDGLKRHDNFEVLRTVVIVGFIVSIAASIFYGFFSFPSTP